MLPKLDRKITFFPHKAQHYPACGQNPKKAQNSKSPTTMFLIQSPTTMWLIPKPAIRYSTIYKAYCYTAILYKISKSFLQSPNSYLASIFTKPKFLFGIYFHKAQILIWHYFIKSKILFWQLFLHYFIKPQY